MKTCSNRIASVPVGITRDKAGNLLSYRTLRSPTTPYDFWQTYRRNTFGDVIESRCSDGAFFLIERDNLSNEISYTDNSGTWVCMGLLPSLGYLPVRAREEIFSLGGRKFSFEELANHLIFLPDEEQSIMKDARAWLDLSSL